MGISVAVRLLRWGAIFFCPSAFKPAISHSTMYVYHGRSRPQRCFAGPDWRSYTRPVLRIVLATTEEAKPAPVDRLGRACCLPFAYGGVRNAYISSAARGSGTVLPARPSAIIARVHSDNDDGGVISTRDRRSGRKGGHLRFVRCNRRFVPA